MSSKSLFPGPFAWLVGGGVLACAIWLGAGLVHGPTRKHSPRIAEPAMSEPMQGAAAPITPAPLQPVPTQANAAPGNGVEPATAPITDDAFLNQHYVNQVVADVKPADTPAQFEQKVRALDPEYAKLLDENATEERRAAVQNAAATNAPKPRPGTDDER